MLVILRRLYLIIVCRVPGAKKTTMTMTTTNETTRVGVRASVSRCRNLSCNDVRLQVSLKEPVNKNVVDGKLPRIKKKLIDNLSVNVVHIPRLWDVTNHIG